MASTQRKIVANTALQVSGKIIGTIIGLATVALMTRHYGPEGYGEFTTVLSFLQMFAILAGFGLPITLAKLMAHADLNERQIVANAFSLRLVSGLIIFAAAPAIGVLLPYSPTIKLGIAVGTLSYLGITLHEMLVAVFQKHLATWMVAISEVLGRAVLLAGTAWAVVSGRGLLAVIAALAAGNLLQFILSYIMARRLTPIRLAFDWPVWREIMAESWPIGLSIAFNLIYLKGDVILLSMLRSQTEVGLYGAAYKVLDVVSVVPYIFMGLVLPLLSAAWSRQDHHDFNRKLSLSFDALAIVAMPLFFGTLATARQVMILIAGAEFAAAGPLLAVLMIGGVAVFWHATYSNALVAMGGQKKMVVFYALNAAISVGLYLWLIPRIGGMGGAIVTAFSELFIAVTVTSIVSSMTHFRPRFTQLGKIFVASLVMFGGLMILPTDWQMILRIMVGAAIYGATLLLIKGVPMDSLRLIFKRA